MSHNIGRESASPGDPTLRRTAVSSESLAARARILARSQTASTYEPPLCPSRASACVGAENCNPKHQAISENQLRCRNGKVCLRVVTAFDVLKDPLSNSGKNSWH